VLDVLGAYAGDVYDLGNELLLNGGPLSTCVAAPHDNLAEFALDRAGALWESVAGVKFPPAWAEIVYRYLEAHRKEWMGRAGCNLQDKPIGGIEHELSKELTPCPTGLSSPLAEGSSFHQPDQLPRPGAPSEWPVNRPSPGSQSKQERARKRQRILDEYRKRAPTWESKKEIWSGAKIAECQFNRWQRGENVGQSVVWRLSCYLGVRPEEID
jgi:hypothetical protein